MQVTLILNFEVCWNRGKYIVGKWEGIFFGKLVTVVGLEDCQILFSIFFRSSIAEALAISRRSQFDWNTL